MAPAGALLAIWLLQLWAERIARASAGTDWLEIVPVALISLGSPEVLRDVGL
jgi:hypothetical protein